MLRHLACLLLAAGTVLAGDAWYLPYEPDADTLVLSHADSHEVLGSAQGRLQVGPAAAFGPGRFGEGLVLPGQARQGVDLR
ncbi:MAG: hypothetical protein M5U09_29440 [Gammaproteobacteria bacterium]|nr:hypothetical protein [Gammaproteobacteria bacterium]